MPIDLDSAEILVRGQAVAAQIAAGTATVEELRQSRVGSENGIFGSRPVRRFKVRNFAVNEDPRDVLRNHADGVREGQVAPYPTDAANGVVALVLRIIEQETPGSATIEIEYGVPVLFPLLPEAWHMTFEGGLETEEVLIDLDGKPVGTPKYQELMLLDKGVAAPANAAFSVDLGDQVLYLQAAVNDTRYVEPMPRNRDAHRLVFWKRVGRLDEVLLSTLKNSHNTVNSDNFRILTIYRSTALNFGGRGTFHWVNHDVSEEPGSAIGQTIPGVLFRVTVVLEHNPEGHQWKQIHQVTFSETGTRGIVRDRAGQPVKETWKRYEEKDFTRILSQF